MLRFLTTVLAVVTGLFVFMFLFFFGIGAMLAGSSQEKPMPANIVLDIDLRQEIADGHSPFDMPAEFGGPALSVVGIVETLEAAKTDDAVKGLLVRGSADLSVNPGQAEEIRDAIEDFRASGKFVITHVQDLASTGLGGYYLASAADEVWMQPGGLILSQGLGISDVFFKGTLDKIGVTAQALHYHEYKTAMHPFLYDAPTEPMLEEDGRMIQSILDSYVAGISDSRKIAPADFTAMLSQGPFIGEEALRARWVDKLGYDIDAEEAAIARAGQGAELVELADYGHHHDGAYDEGAVIALIQGEGMVVDGPAETDFFSDAVLSGEDISQAFLDAAEDEDVKAIVFRINSPGGSVNAPAQISNAIERARAAGKPVVVNMSGVAASSAYWMSAGADRIVAEPSTITGSIGVVGGKFILAGLYEKLGITTAEQTAGGDKVMMWSDAHPFTPEEWLAYREIFDSIYGSFVAHVANGRGMDPAEVELVAKGRVWTGSDAKARGLVDELGGLKVAIKLAKELGGVAAEESVELRQFPAQRSFLEELFGAFGTSARVAHSLAVAAEILELQPTAEFLGAMRESEAARTAPVRAAIDEPAIR